jgi:hypothetical protein
MKDLVDAEMAASGGGDVWLRGNARPAAALAGVMVAAAALAVVVVVALRLPAWIMGLVAAIALVDLAVAAGLAWAASRPRLACRGDVLEVRLSPLGVERVPLEVVECVFPGSELLGTDPDAADRRVSTLVLRLAERAVAWRSRPVSSPWGRWEDGSIVFDGRWCEPLSPAVARNLSDRLLEARRRVAAEPPR